MKRQVDGPCRECHDTYWTCLCSCGDWNGSQVCCCNAGMRQGNRQRVLHNPTSLQYDSVTWCVDICLDVSCGQRQTTGRFLQLSNHTKEDTLFQPTQGHEMSVATTTVVMCIGTSPGESLHVETNLTLQLKVNTVVKLLTHSAVTVPRCVRCPNPRS